MVNLLMINKYHNGDDNNNTLIEKDHLGDRSPEKDCCYL